MIVKRTRERADRGGADQRVEVRDLNVTYWSGRERVNALHDINVTIADGEFVCLIGPSGSGKTTFLNVMAGFVRPTSGEVMIGGRPVGDNAIRRGYVFQEYALFPWLTVAGNVEVALEAAGMPKRERRAAALEHLSQVALDQFADAYPHHLSGGMKQRTAVARALAYDPPMMLFDEPFGALDALTRERLQRLVTSLYVQADKTFIYVTHNISEAVFLGRRILVFSPRPGKVAADVNVDLDYPRDEDSPEFQSIVTSIRKQIDAHEQAGPADASDHVAMKGA